MMRPRRLRMSSFALFSALLFVTACEDARVTPPNASFDMNESRLGDNSEFFFATPLGPTPGEGDAGYDMGAENALLVPYVRVCETDGAETAAGCLDDVTELVTGSAIGLAMSLSGDLYQVGLQTKALDRTKRYRIEVWGLPFECTPDGTGCDEAQDRSGADIDLNWLFGWRDIENSPSRAACTFEPFCLTNYRQTVPVRVRIEQYVFCPVARNCAVQFVQAGTDARLVATPSQNATAELFIPGQAGTDFSIALKPCTDDENELVESYTSLSTFGPCVRTVTESKPSLSQAPTLSFCGDFPIDVSTFEVDPAQIPQITLTHFRQNDVDPDVIESSEALPHAHDCAAEGSIVSRNAPSSLFARVARSIGETVTSWLTPKPLQATTLVIDRGGGGQLNEEDCCGSFFKLVLPAKFEYALAGDDYRVGRKGEEETLTVRVTDLLGLPVAHARVAWVLFSAPAGDAALTSAETVLTDENGIAEVTVLLSETAGNTVVRATSGGIGIADPRGVGCTTSAGPAGCNGPRTSYDPFIPLNSSLDGTGVVESPVEVAEGTFRPFTICTRGAGSNGC